MEELLDVPYNLRGNKDEAILDAMQEIENLRKDTVAWIDVANLKQEEIESLRHNLEAASKETSRLSTELIEWERRARLMHRERHFRNWMAFLDNHPEATKWFKGD